MAYSMNLNLDGKPSTCTSDYWIYALNKSDKFMAEDVNMTGKWMIFNSRDYIDEAWEKVKDATEKGLLWRSSKVSTMKDKDQRPGQAKGGMVICVYTYDWTDQVDVLRIRLQLTELGFTQKLSYKSDADTLAGNYSHTGQKVAKYTL